MKVLIVSDASSNYFSSYVQRLSLIKDGLTRSGVFAETLYIGDYFFFTPSLARPLNTPFYFKLAKEYDFVHIASNTSGIFLMALAKLFKNLRTVRDVHGYGIGEALLARKGVYDMKGSLRLFSTMIFEPITTHLSKYFVIPSETLRQRYISQGIDQQRIEVIYNGVDTEIFHPSDWPVENETFTVTYAGSFNIRWQGVEILALAARRLKDSDIKFKMIGFGPRDAGLKQELQRMLGSKVELIDRIPQRTLVHHLNRSNVLVIPRSCPVDQKDWKRLRNAFGWLPTKFSEYVATGRPVIVTTLDESSEFVEQYNCGFICNPNPKALAEAILEAKKTSQKLLQEKGANGRRLAQVEFDVSVIGRKYHRFLKRILVE